CAVYGRGSVGQIAVACNSSRTVDELFRELRQRERSVCATHNSMDHGVVGNINCDFLDGQFKVLVINVDILQVVHVINFELPESSSGYLSSVGIKSGLGSCIVINLVTSRDDHFLKYMNSKRSS
ncbi:hypothetical protein SELMODRAFT_116138, partial [Selaginella moellendorffii]